MPSPLATLHYPHERILLGRTKLAYVHLRNLLTDAKRDRAARVFGYVSIWLPDELVLLYLQEGELVNATRRDVHGQRALAIAEALEQVPHEPEYGEICFHEADDEQLACMFTTHVSSPEPWPEELTPSDPTVLFPYLMSTTYDGVLEIVVDGAVNFLTLRDGAVQRGFLTGPAKGNLVDRVAHLFQGNGRPRQLSVRRWPVPPPLPVQAAPALVQAYRQLVTGLVQRLVDEGKESAPGIADYARRILIPHHPSLEAFSVLGTSIREPVADADELTEAVAAWISQVVLAAIELDTQEPERILKELTWERRHMFQSAGFYEKLPWKVM